MFSTQSRSDLKPHRWLRPQALNPRDHVDRHMSKRFCYISKENMSKEPMNRTKQYTNVFDRKMGRDWG